MTRVHDPLRVAFDHRIFSNQKHGGISRYFARIAEHLPEFGVAPKIIAPFYQSEYLDDLPSGLVWGRRFDVRSSRLRPRVVLDELLARPLASAFGADIVHESYHHYRSVAPKRARVVTTVYDLIYEFYKTSDEANALFRRCLDSQLARAEKVICISESTRLDLIRFFPAVADKTVVVHFGFDARAGEIDSDEGSPHAKPYILYVGMRWGGYKNFAGLVRAFAVSPRLRDAFDLVAIGGGAFTSEEEALIAEQGVADKVFRRDADDRELWRHYRQAAVFAYPSLYEGFGIPPLEAMAADCPVVTMNISSMPEVCGDAAEYASPDDPGSLREALERVLFSPGRAAELRAAGRKRVTLFSWRECARQTAGVYRSLF